MIYYAIAFFLGGVLTALLMWWLNSNRLRRYRQHKRDLMHRVRRAEHKAELGNLAGNLAHEIRNPLSIIKVNLQLLAEDIRSLLQKSCSEGSFDFSLIDEPERKFRRQLRKIDTVTAEADRLAETLNDFLRYAGRMELQLGTHNLNEILDDMIDFYEPQAQEKSVTMRSSLSGGQVMCRVDPDLIKQAILNLFINSVQAMSDGGELMVRSSVCGDDAQIEIIDTGPGIAPEHQGKVFDPYYTTRSGGTGLGLPTCRRIIEEHGGHIELHSEVGKGTSFTITLPLQK
jgi:signal transduction histidine kinase